MASAHRQNEMHSEQALSHIVDELMASSQRVLEYSRNRSATGLHRERLVESYLRRITPKAFDIGSGFVYGEEESSKQVDLMIYDQLNFAPLFDEGGYKVVLPEAVVHSIEVKSKLDKRALHEAFSNVLSVTALNTDSHGIIFGFDGLSIDTTFDHIEQIARQLPSDSHHQIAYRLPTAIVSLNNWVIIGRPAKQDGSAIEYARFKTLSFGEQFKLFFASIYYKLYGYRRKLHPDGALPSLKDQGFQLGFGGDIDWLRISAT